jgi:hypothetical protein
MADAKKSGAQGERRMPFWPAWLDDAGLDPYTVRVFLHVVRVAARSREFYEARPATARACRMSPRRVFTALRELVKANVLAIEGEPSYGRLATRFTLRPLEEWRPTVHHVHGQPCTDGGFNRAPRAAEGTEEGSLRKGSHSGGPPARAVWPVRSVAQLVKVWEERHGKGTARGDVIAGQFTRLREGGASWPGVLAAWQAYVEQEDPKRQSPGAFATKWATWLGPRKTRREQDGERWADEHEEQERLTQGGDLDQEF